MRNIIFIVSLLGSATAWAEENTYYLTGLIEKGSEEPYRKSTFDIFRESYEERPFTEVVLNLEGGYLDVARQLAEMIREYKLTTRLESAQSICESACVLVFMAGVERRAHPEARILIHGVGTHEDGLGMYGLWCVPWPGPGCDDLAHQERLDAENNTHKSFDDLERLGLSPLVREAFFRRPKDPNWISNRNLLQIEEWVGPAEAFYQYGLVTHPF